MAVSKWKMKMTRGRRILLGILILLIVFRLFLPYIVLRYVNKKLANLSEYYGHVEDIDIALYRGAYTIKDIKIEKREDKDTIPFFVSPSIDLSVQWKAIFKRKIVGEIYVESPVINFVKGKHKEEDVKQDTADFKDLIKDLMPLTVNHFEVKNGQVHYIDNNVAPKVDVAINDLYISANNLSNVSDSAKLLPANLVATGNAYEGAFKLNVDFDGLNKIPTFDLNAEVTDVNLVLLNDFLRAYGNFDVNKGTFGLYTELAAKDGNFGGYVKPLVKDLKVGIWNEGNNFKQILWETVVTGGALILTNVNTGELGTKVPVNGKFDDPNINTWKAISYVLRNAFVHALRPAIDNTINVHKLEDDPKKTFLEKVFGKDKKDKNKKKEDKKKKGNKTKPA